MKFSKFAKKHAAEVVFVALIALGFYIYFVVYRTPSRIYWYKTMIHDIGYLLKTFVLHKLTALRHHL